VEVAGAIVEVGSWNIILLGASVTSPSQYGILMRVLKQNAFLATGRMFVPIAACEGARRELEGYVRIKVCGLQSKARAGAGLWRGFLDNNHKAV